MCLLEVPVNTHRPAVYGGYCYCTSPINILSSSESRTVIGGSMCCALLLQNRNKSLVHTQHLLSISAYDGLLMLLAVMCERHKLGLRSDSLTEVSNPSGHIQASFKRDSKIVFCFCCILLKKFLY